MSMYTFDLTKEQREGLEKLGFVPVTTTGVITTNVKEDDTFPKNKDTFYYSDFDGKVKETYWANTIADRGRQLIGNVFRTKEEAEFMVERLKVIAELKKYAKGYRFKYHNQNWIMAYNSYSEKINTFFCYEDIYGGTIYFASEDDAQVAIANIGKERLKKYYFMVED